MSSSSDLLAADYAMEPANVFWLELHFGERIPGPLVLVDDNHATRERCLRIEAGCFGQGPMVSEVVPCTARFVTGRAEQQKITVY